MAALREGKNRQASSGNRVRKTPEAKRKSVITRLQKEISYLSDLD